LLSIPEKSHKFIVVFAGFAAASLLHFALGSLSLNAEPRYFSIDAAILFFLSAVLFFQGRAAKTLRRILILIPIGFSLAIQAQNYGVLNFFEIRSRTHAFGGWGAERPWRGENLTLKIADVIQPRLGSITNPNILIFPTVANEIVARFIEPNAFWFILHTRGRQASFFYSGSAGHEPWRDFNKTGHGVLPELDFYLVGPIEDDRLEAQVRQDGHPVEDLQLFFEGQRVRYLWVSAKKQI
jgi:hypothetical protein